MGGGADLAQLLKWTEADANASSRPELTRAFFQLQDALRDRGDVVTGKRRSNSVTTGEESGSRGSSLDELEKWQGPMRTISSLIGNAEIAQQLREAFAADVANCLANLRDEASSAGASSMLNSTFSLPVDCRRVPSPCCIVVHSWCQPCVTFSAPAARCRVPPVGLLALAVVARSMLLVAWHCLRTFRMRATISAISSWRSSANPRRRGSSRVWRCTHMPCGMPLFRIACRVSVLCLAALSHRPSFSVYAVSGQILAMRARSIGRSLAASSRRRID